MSKYMCAVRMKMSKTTTRVSWGYMQDNGGSILTAVDATSSLFGDLLFVELFPDCRLAEFSLGPKASPTVGVCPFIPTPGP
jgi:hypothetical protein